NGECCVLSITKDEETKDAQIESSYAFTAVLRAGDRCGLCRRESERAFLSSANRSRELSDDGRQPLLSARARHHLEIRREIEKQDKRERSDRDERHEDDPGREVYRRARRGQGKR